MVMDSPGVRCAIALTEVVLGSINAKAPAQVELSIVLLPRQATVADYSCKKRVSSSTTSHHAAPS